MTTVTLTDLLRMSFIALSAAAPIILMYFHTEDHNERAMQTIFAFLLQIFFGLFCYYCGVHQ